MQNPPTILIICFYKNEEFQLNVDLLGGAGERAQVVWGYYLRTV